MKFICGIRNKREGGRECGEVFYSWADLADHCNCDHRLQSWIAGGTVRQEELRPDRRPLKEICGDGKKTVDSSTLAARAREERTPVTRISGMAQHAPALREPQKTRLQALRSERGFGVRPLAHVRELPVRCRASTGTRVFSGSLPEQQRQLRTRQCALGDTASADDQPSTGKRSTVEAEFTPGQ